VVELERGHRGNSLDDLLSSNVVRAGVSHISSLFWRDGIELLLF
jgi:hypothetical protein